jgi:hypothetical protein
MKTIKKLAVATATAALLTTGVAAPAQAAKAGQITTQASGICLIWHWWPFGC